MSSGERKAKQRRERTGQIILVIACVLVLSTAGLQLIGMSGPDGHKKSESGTGTENVTGTNGTAADIFPESGGQENRETDEKSDEESDEESDENIELSEDQRLIAEADRLAAGYDYDKAAALIKSRQGYEGESELTGAIARYEAAKGETVKYSSVTKITHVFFHSLIVDPGLAFDGDEDAASYNRVMTTVDEFKKIIQEMYDRGYVLVSMHDMAHIETRPDGTEVMVPGEIYLPPGKIPYVLSVDDPSYYHYMEGDGFASRLVIDGNGNVVCEYIQPDGTVVTGAYDVMPIVDEFVREHPDAAYRGARGVLALTGYNGVLGYRTDPAYQTGNGLDEEQQAWLAAHPDFDYEKECAAARAVAEAMKAEGWEFASHSYGHRNYGTISYGDLVWDINTWINTVGSIVGETDIMIFAYGSDIGDWHPYTEENEKYQYLKSMGFDYFCNVDSGQYWVQVGSDYLRQGRRNLDGIRMWEAISGGTDRVSDLFDAGEVFDQTRPTPVR